MACQNSKKKKILSDTTNAKKTKVINLSKTITTIAVLNLIFSFFKYSANDNSPILPGKIKPKTQDREQYLNKGLNAILFPKRIFMQIVFNNKIRR